MPIKYLHSRGRSADASIWVLACLLSAATLFMAFKTVRDVSTRRASAQMFMEVTASQRAAQTHDRFTQLARETFAPVLLDARGLAMLTHEVIPALVSQQRASKTCVRCRESFRVLQYGFWRDGHAYVGDVGDEMEPGPALADVIDSISQVENTALRQQEHSQPRLHIHAHKRFGQLIIVTIAGRESDGSPTILAAAVPRSAFTASLFSARGLTNESPSIERIVAEELFVQAEDDQIIFGRAPIVGEVSATVHPSGALSGLAITASALPGRIPAALRVEASIAEVAPMILLTGCTLLSIVLAATLSRRRVELANARANFIASVSHDLRMPLAQTLLASEMLFDEANLSDRERWTRVVRRETQRLAGMVDNVLLYARSGSARISPVREEFVVDMLLADVADSVALVAEEAAQSIDIHADGNFTMRGDSALLRQALTNLVHNAIKFGPAGQRIAIGATCSDESAQLYVEDSGPGIPSNEQSRLLRAYERLEQVSRTERTGAGLGLAIVHEIAQASGGCVRFEKRAQNRFRAILEIPRCTTVASLQSSRS